MADIPTMSLKAAPMQFATFTPVQYQAKPMDMSILQNSLAQREARMDKAAQAEGAVTTALGQIGAQLHNDPTTNAFFENYKKGIVNNINSQVDAGNYGNAFRTATKLAGQVLVDPQITGRIRANENFKKYTDSIDERVRKGTLSQGKANWAKTVVNPYRYEDVKDNDGNIIGGTEWTPETVIYDDPNYVELATEAAKLNVPDQIRKGSSSQSSVTNEDGTGRGGGSSTDYTLSQLTEEEIQKTLPNVINSIPNGWEQIQQDYEFRRDTYENLVLERNNLAAINPNDPELIILDQKIDEFKKYLCDDNGDFVDYKTFATKMVYNTTLAKPLAYRNESNITSSSSSVDNQGSGGSGGYGGGGANGGIVTTPQLDTPKVPGKRVGFSAKQLAEGLGLGTVTDVSTPHQQNTTTTTGR